MGETEATPQGSDDGYALDVARIIAAPPEAIFDAFIALYDDDRPDWVTSSQLDLRPGGHWTVGFDVPGGSVFQEERVLTVVARPHHLAYDMRAVFTDAPDFATHVDLTIEPVPEGQRVQLVQQGFQSTETRDTFAAAWPDVLAEVARRVTARSS